MESNKKYPARINVHIPYVVKWPVSFSRKDVESQKAAPSGGGTVTFGSEQEAKLAKGAKRIKDGE
jgi:hypothetical protein